jgi:hypothetical protein
MNDQFDELARSMAQSVTRRGALKKFGVGLAGIALAALGLANKAQAGKCLDPHCVNECRKGCQFYRHVNPDYFNTCVELCIGPCYRDCGV